MAKSASSARVQLIVATHSRLERGHWVLGYLIDAHTALCGCRLVTLTDPEPGA